MEISATLQDQFADAINTALGSTAPEARFYSAAYAAELAVCPLNATGTSSFGAAATGLITLDIDPVVENTGTPVSGTAALLALYATTGAAATAFVVAMGLAATGSEITMSNPAILTTDTIQVSSLTIQVPTGTPS